MSADFESCYRAIRARDARFDGLFFTGVKTTGIYCRPVCSARTPKASSCTFFTTAAAAERAGFRPCLRCRPELAPGLPNAGGMAITSLEEALLKRLQERALHGDSVEELARQTGFSSRHLRRLMLAKFGVTPVEIMQTQRLLFAKKLLQETALPIIEVSTSAGFGSLRQFNTLFKMRYRVAPSALRRAGTSADGLLKRDYLTLKLAYRAPFAWTEMLAYLTKRAIPGVETVLPDASYARSVQVGKKSGWISVRCESTKNFLEVQAPESLASVLFPVLAGLRNAFDLDANPLLVDEHLRTDPFLKEVVEAYPGLRMPGAWNVFELAVRAVLGQQVSVAGATTLAGRLTQRFGEPIQTPIPGLTHLSPTAKTLAAAGIPEIAAIGMPRTRANTILELAKFAVRGGLQFSSAATPAEVVTALKQVPGIGEWTAQYITMRALRFPDAFPAGDLGLRKAVSHGPLVTEAELLKRAERWRPWRAYAAAYLWQSLKQPKG